MAPIGLIGGDMSAIDEIKAKLDLVDVIGAYTPLKKAGNVYKALCPFHNEKTESFVVFPNSQSWHCFGQCNEGGDLFKFVMKHEGLDFREALAYLAQKAGVTLESYNSDQAMQRQEAHQTSYAILKETAAFYHQQLPTSVAAQYLTRRGLTPDTARQFGLGYAADQWANLTQHLLRLGYQEEALIEANVTIRHESGRLFDRFRDRFMIPIRDEQGRVIGFGGRAFSEDRMPKYINSPQSDLFDKSSVIFGYDMARRDIRESETAVVVEGYLDVIQAHQAGFRNVVGTMGTALTKQHVQILSKHATRLVFALDSDTAGIKATLRGLDVAREELSGSSSLKVLDVNGILRQSGKLKVDIRVLELPFGKDPDEFIRAQPDQWPVQVAAAKPLAHYLIAAAKASLPPLPSILEREKAAQEILPLLMVEDSVINQHYLQQLSLELKLDERAMLEWVQSHLVMRDLPSAKPITRSKKYGQSTGLEQVAVQGYNFSIGQKAKSVEHYCLSVLLHDPYRIYDANRLLQLSSNAASWPLSAMDFSQSEYQTIFDLLLQATQQIDEDPQAYLLSRLDHLLQDLVNEILLHRIDAYTRNDRLGATEVAALTREKYNPAPYRMDDDFALSFITLRANRLEREVHEMIFLHQEAQHAQDSEATDWYETEMARLAMTLRYLKQAKSVIMNPQLETPKKSARVKDQTA